MKKLVVRFKSIAFETERKVIEITNENFSTFICCIAISYSKIEIMQSILTDIIYLDTDDKNHFKKMVEWLDKYA